MSEIRWKYIFDQLILISSTVPIKEGLMSTLSELRDFCIDSGSTFVLCCIKWTDQAWGPVTFWENTLLGSVIGSVIVLRLTFEN